MKYVVSNIKNCIVMSLTDIHKTSVNAKTWAESIGGYKTLHESDSEFLKQVYVRAIEVTDEVNQMCLITYSNIVNGAPWRGG